MGVDRCGSGAREQKAKRKAHSTLNTLAASDTMSTVYATEPATSGRVIFNTTRGPIEIQLWCRECPETTRVFLQLCLDGYFDNMIFHRIMPHFLIQTGALRYPESSSTSAAAMNEYRSRIHADQGLERRPYEVHSRIRFNHRGQVAMALTVSEEEDAEVQPQFFITLDEASNLDGMHVIFGKVEAPTIFNAIKIGETDVDESTHQPTGDLAHAPRVLSVKIVDNPIHTNLVPQPKVPWRAEKKEKARKKKRKGKRDVNVLSFGDEVEEEGAGLSGMKSSHDVLHSKSLSKAVDANVKVSVQEIEAANGEQRVNKGDSSTGEPTKSLSGVRETVEHTLPVEETKSNKTVVKPEVLEEEVDYCEEAVEEPPSNVEPLRDGTEEVRSDGMKVPGNTSMTSKPKKASIVEAMRAKYTKGRKKTKKEREEGTMEKLLVFRSKVRDGVAAKRAKHSKKDDKENSLASRMARRAEAANLAPEQDDQVPTYHGQILESDGDDEGGGEWLNTRFKCRKHMDHHAKEENGDLGGDGRNTDDYKVIDDRDGTHHHRSHSGHSRKRHKGNRHDRHRHSSNPNKRN